MRSRSRDKKILASPAAGGVEVPLPGLDGAGTEAPTSNGSAAHDGGPPPEESRAAPRPRRRRRWTGGDILLLPPRLLMRLLFPRLLDRYVMGELLGPLLFGWSLFIVLFVFSVNLWRLAQLAARGARLDAIGEMLLLQVVLASVLCLPMAVLLASLMAFGRLSGDSELVAMQAGGVPNFRPIRNAFILGAALSFVGLAINEFVVPPAGKRLHFLEDQVKAELKGRVIEDLTDQKAFVIQDFEEGQLARLVIARRFEPENPPYPATLRDVTYVQYQKGVWNTIVSAQRAEWLGQSEWRFIEAETQFRHQVVQGKRLNIGSSDLVLRLNKTPDQVRREQKDADQMSYREMSAYIEDLKEQQVRSRTIREFEVEKERKLAVPFAALVLAMIGAPLGIRRQRSTAGVGIGLSLLIIILYYAGMSFLGVLGENGQVGPVEAAWGCNVIALVAGLFLTARSSY